MEDFSQSVDLGAIAQKKFVKTTGTNFRKNPSTTDVQSGGQELAGTRFKATEIRTIKPPSRNRSVTDVEASRRLSNIKEQEDETWNYKSMPVKKFKVATRTRANIKNSVDVTKRD